MNIPTVDLAQTGANIANLRKAAGFSVHDLQMVFGFNSPQAIYKWQNGAALPTVDIYEYLQVNLAYSSSRMASNRLTREQVEDLYRTNKLSVSFEPTKVDDIIEIMNHFICTKEMVDTIMEPLTPSLIRRYHYCLTYGTYADQRHQIGIGEYRKNPSKLGAPARLISSKLDELIQSYENKSIDMDAILDFHVRFEKIHPFEDYNGRVGRLIMMKECLVRKRNMMTTPIQRSRRASSTGQTSKNRADRSRNKSIKTGQFSKMENCPVFLQNYPFFIAAFLDFLIIIRYTIS